MIKYKIKLEGEAETYQDLLGVLIDALDNLNVHTEIIMEHGLKMSDIRSSREFRLEVKLERGDESCYEIRDPDAGMHGMGNVFGR
jgi:hypothetical protein